MNKLIFILIFNIFISIIDENYANGPEDGKIKIRVAPNQHVNIVHKPNAAAHHSPQNTAVHHSSDDGKVRVRVKGNVNIVHKPNTNQNSPTHRPPVTHKPTAVHHQQTTHKPIAAHHQQTTHRPSGADANHSQNDGKIRVRVGSDENSKNSDNQKKGVHFSVKRNHNDRNSPNVFTKKTNTTPKNNNDNNNKQATTKKVRVKIVHNKKPPPPPPQKIKWKPKPQKVTMTPPKKYSGWKPVEWGNTTNIIDEDGQVLNRTSQTKFEEYMEEIFGTEARLDTALLTPEELNGRELADPGEYPHMAAIGVIRDFEDIIDWKCGGSLISRQYVLTAAHCCDFGGEHPTHVELGAIDLRKPSSNFEDGSVTKEIEEVIIHPYYDDDSYYYDIGLLKLTENIIFTSKVRPVQLWPLEYIPYEFAFACGFGATAFGHVQTNVLTEMNLDLIGNEECNKALPFLGETPFGILDNQLCARDLDGIVDTCQGDSGGPLQLNLPSRRRPLHSLIGIVSYGVFCGSSYPGVYTRVHSYLPWIESIVWPRTFKVYNPNFVFPNN